MVILGIDFGLSNIGLAISRVGLAEPLSVIPNQPQVLKRIAAICGENQVEKIVIGLPDGQMGEVVKGFAGQLFLLTQIAFEFADETLTSKEALAKMIEIRKKKKIRQTQADAYAAACILQNYLEGGNSV